MKKVFLIHGYRGEPNGGWRPWLMGKFAEEEVWACALPMPNPYEPKQEDWVKTIQGAIEEDTENTFLIGHSLGGTAILRYLEILPVTKKIGGVISVAGPIEYVHRNNNEPIQNFFSRQFNFDHIKKVCKNFTVIHGDNDPAVPFSQAEELSRKLKCNLISIPNGGHLNGSSGWRELPQALEALDEMMR